MGLANLNIKERMMYHNVRGLGIAVINNARISMAEHYGDLEAITTKSVNSSTIFSACSISKFLTGMLVMLLIEKGLVELDEDINKKLKSWKVPDNKFTENKNVTLRNLLCHQSGIIDPDESFTQLKSNDGIPTMVDLLNGKSPYCKVPIEVQYEPERNFQYSDAGYCIIQLLIEDVTGKSFEDIAGELIFHPLEMYNSPFSIPEKERKNFSCGHDKSGELVDGKYPLYPYPAASGLWSTPTDLSILVIELINSLKGKSKTGLSLSKAKEMITAQGCKEWTGLGVFLDDSKGKLEISSLGWGVGFQCMMVAYPFLENGLVIMTNTDLGVHQLKGIIGDIYNANDFGL
ncbi:serine hydrolase domain-containing protein [Neobacillus terrae]|uniref:serine hydrolase domain-containing protein n=1 Tax=Neobacillus terrae TaxID=3034837 RepID=UPI00140E678E|nr:serine hydrolase domain-containing protein [Neobacillus terrae]NHM34005.1 beta-lactamase family protein [Neobacillus terrae]